MQLKNSTLRIFISLLLLICPIVFYAQKHNYDDKIYKTQNGGMVDNPNGVFTVSPMGQATYEYPIKLPEGTGSICPKLSICYSSSIGEGAFGHGMDLNGLSMISRVPADLAHDGYPGCVDVNTARFALDGTRLIEINRNEDYITYATEVNNYARIRAYGEETSPSSFVMETKDGLTYTFIPDSELANDTCAALFWMLTKVVDTQGNYFTITYSGSFTSLLPSRIDYTGNEKSSLLPDISVRINYTFAYKQAKYICGMKIERDDLISDIIVEKGNKTIKRYDFLYDCNGYNFKYPYCFLEKIKEYTSKSQLIKVTKFDWSKEDSSDPPINKFIDDNIKNVSLTMGDFNGDGKTDFIATPKDKDVEWGGYRLYLSNGNSFDCVCDSSYKIAGGYNKPVIEDVQSADFNGDGYDDLLLLKKEWVYKSEINNNIPPNGKYNKRVEAYSTYLYLSKESSDGRYFERPRLILRNRSHYRINVAEFNGDGVADLFVWFDNNNECETYCSVYNNGTIAALIEYQPYFDLINWDNVLFVDHNGDGITDILNIDNNGYTLMLSDGKGYFITDSTIKGNYPNKNNYVTTGDLNGDGKTDLFVSYDMTSTRTRRSEIILSNGINGYHLASSRKYTCLYNCDLKKQQYYVVDMNGDGHDDILVVNKSTDNTTDYQSKYYLSIYDYSVVPSKLNLPIEALDKSMLYFGDFNGDGKKDILTTSNWSEKSNWNGYNYIPMLSNCNNLVTKITDCLGNTTEIVYKTMSDPAVHKRGNNANYPVSSFCSSWPLVYRVITPDGVGGRKTVQYNYENALRHYRGRGVLGFGRITTTDFKTNAWTAQYSTVHPTTYMLLPTSNLSFIGDKVLSESYTDYNLALSPDTSAVFSLLPSYTTEFKYEYNSQQKIKEVHTSMTYDDYGNLLKSVTVDGNTTTTVTNVYTDDLERWYLGRLTSSTVTKKTNGVSAPNHKTTYEYDSETGLLSSETLDPTNKKFGYKKTYKRDLFGNITESTITPLQTTYAPRTTKTTYDSTGKNVLSETNSLGFTTTKTIDPLTGLVIESKDANGNAVNYEYDPLGRVKRKTSALGYEYSITGWSDGMEDAPANSLYFIYTESTGIPCSWTYYDCLGREVRSVVEDPTRTKHVYADIVYNSKGQIEKSSEPYFKGSTSINWITNEYDDCGRLIKITQPDGKCTTTAYNGLVTTVTDPLGHTSSKEIDTNGHLIRSTDANGGTLEYVYDAAGNNTEIHGPRTITTMKYDRNGNCTSLDDPDAGLTKYEYNVFGELVKATNDKGAVKYEYDNGGRLIKEIRPDITITNTYDTQLKGYLSSTQTSEGVVQSYTYDQYGRILSEKLIEGSSRKQFSVGYTYNSINKISTITYPSSSLVIKQEYSETGMLQAVKNAQTGHVYWQVDPLNISAKGQIESETLGNGLTTNSQYDFYSGNLKNRVVRNGNNKLLDWTYRFDYNGNLLERSDNKRNLSETFTYDNLDRLHTASKNGVQYQRMEYDAAGNIIYKSDVGTYTYVDGTNKIATVTADSYTPKEWDFIEYTSFNKISGIGANGDKLLLRYGPEQQRVYAQLKSNGNSLYHYYFGKIYEEINDDYGDITKKCYIFAGDKRIALVETHIDNSSDSTQIYYFHHDHLGSVMAYSDSLGNIVQELSYDAWGRRRNVDTWEFYDNISDADALDDYGFGDHEHIDLFEIVNMDGRMYDPVLGRFLSPDPFVQAPDFTQSFNRYAYCVNNPLSLIDPSGYSWLSKNWKSIFASCIGIAVSALTAGSAAGLTVAIIAGAAGGAAGAFAGALLNGANIGQIAKATFLGGFWGAVSGLANNVAGDAKKLFERIALHTLFEGAMEGAQGGNILHGMMMGAVSSGGGEFISAKCSSFSKAGKIAANAALSGTVSEIGGGKFANGAITGAFSIMFNDIMHDRMVAQGEKLYKYIELGEAAELISPAGVVIGEVTRPYILTRRQRNCVKAYIESDGKLTLGEARVWWKVGKGEAINVDISSLQISGVSAKDFGSNSSMSLSTENHCPFDVFVVYGDVTATREGNYMKIEHDTYDFNVEPNDWITRTFKRNVLTLADKVFHNIGNEFKIHINGRQRLK